MQTASIQNPLIKRIRQEALFGASGMIERSLQAVQTGLEEAENSARSNAMRLLLGDAIVALAKAAPRIRGEFPARVDQAIGQALQAAASQPLAAPSPARPATQDDLTLIEDAEISRFVEASRLQQATLPVVEQELSLLDSLISSVMGLPVVRAELNPLRPEVFSQTLFKLLDEQVQDDALQAQWVRQLTKPFAHELKKLYQSINTVLQDQGVEEARYRLRLTEGGPAPKKKSAEKTGGKTGGSVGAGSGAKGKGAAKTAGAPAGMAFPLMTELAQAQPQLSHELIHGFLYRQQWANELSEPLAAGYYDHVRAQQQQLQQQPAPTYDADTAAQVRAQALALSVVDRPARTVGLQDHLPPTQWGELASPKARTEALMDLKAQANTMDQVVGLDAVRTLVAQVAKDERVLAPVREAVVALEPALLRMAMREPRYFGNEQHPARRLVESIAQRSFSCNDEYGEDFEAFMHPVRDAVKRLNAISSLGSDNFESQLKRLESLWHAQDAAAQQAHEASLKSVEFAQERQQLADKIAWEFSLRSDLEGVPAVVAEFLFKDWSLVIAHAQLTDERRQLDPGGYLAVVSNLLWSVKRQLTVREPARLFEILPGLIATLRRGLAMLGKAEEETQAFFDALIRYHDPVLRLRRLRSARDAEASRLAPLDGETSFAAMFEETALFESEPPPLERPQPSPAEQPWLGQRERALAGFDLEEDVDETLAAELAKDDFPDTRPNALAQQDETERLAAELAADLDAALAPKPPAAPKPPPAPATDALPRTAPGSAPGSAPATVPDAPPAATPAASAPKPAAKAPAKAPRPAAKPAPVPTAVQQDPIDQGDQTEQDRIRAQIARLRLNDWVDLKVRKQWVRAQLRWTNSNSTLFMFISGAGQPHSMTRRTLEKLLRQHHLRPVAVGEVVDQALHNLGPGGNTPRAGKLPDETALAK